MSDPEKKLTPKQKLSHFRNLVVVSLQDGEIGEAEKTMLKILADKWELSADEINQVLGNPDTIELALPTDPEACFQQIYDLTELMIIDGVLKSSEKEICLGMATKLGHDPSVVDIIIEEILAGNQHLSSEERIHAAIKARMERT